MEWMIQLFEFNMVKPELYGWFHILCLMLTGALVILLLHHRLCCYLSTYAVMAGICVMLHPSSVFTENILMNVQTMVNHGTMVAIGVYLLLCGYVKCEKRTLIEVGKVFAVCIMIAILLNEWANRSGILEEHSFNMFYISPYVKGGLPVYGIIQEWVPYPMDLMIYIAGFTLKIKDEKKKEQAYEYLSCR